MPEEGLGKSLRGGRDSGSLPSRPVFWVFIFTALGSAAWLGLILWAPYLRSHCSPWQGFLYTFFSPVCHQLPSRCFYLFGQPLAVCARCLGIYSGFMAGTAFYPFLRGFHSLELPQSKIFILISLPIVVDTTGNFTGLWNTANGIRLATGFLWGTILPFYFITGIADLVLSRRSKNIA